MSDMKKMDLTFCENYDLYKDLEMVADNLLQHLNASLDGCGSVKYDLPLAIEVLYEQIADMAKCEDGDIVNVYAHYFEIAETCMKIIAYNEIQAECDDDQEDQTPDNVPEE